MDGLVRVRCRGCGGDVPDVGGPTHPYMLASPGCWAVYGRWMADLARSSASPPGVGTHHVDCYAVQHPDGAEVDRRQRQSVAVHLVALCLLLDHGLPPAVATRARARTTETVAAATGLDDWPLLAPPADRGGTTISDVARADADALGPVVRRWVEECWAAWDAHHATVRAWSDVVAASL